MVKVLPSDLVQMFYCGEADGAPCGHALYDLPHLCLHHTGPMGVLTQGSVHLLPYAEPPIETNMINSISLFSASYKRYAF